MSGNSQEFDTFLAYNSSDRTTVQIIKANLEEQGIRVWLDSEQITPGRWIQDVIQQSLKNAKSIVICLGPTGVGRFQAVELRAAIAECLEKEIPVIPLLLPNSDFPRNLLFLKQLMHVQLTVLDDKLAIQMLIWGITGIKPDRYFQNLRWLEGKLEQTTKQVGQLRRWAFALSLLLASITSIAIYAGLANANRVAKMEEKLASGRFDKIEAKQILVTNGQITETRQGDQALITPSFIKVNRDDASGKVGVLLAISQVNKLPVGNIIIESPSITKSITMDSNGRISNDFTK